jgi:tetratricopeptide (TPR) repeat protein
MEAEATMDRDLLRKLERGREHYESREFNRAEPYLLAVAEAEAGFADVMNMLGVIYHDRGRVGLAQEYFEKALRLNPRYTEAALNLAVTYNEQGKYDEAKKIHEHATSLAPQEEREIEPYARGKLSNMHADLGRAYAELQLYDPAVAQYRAALELAPDFADIRTRLGQLLKDAGRLDEALAELQLVKESRPGYVPGRISLGATYLAKGEKEKAKQEWDDAIELDPENRTAGMYIRMVEQMLAQDEADAAGMHLEVEQPVTESTEGGDELSFSFDGEEASLASVPPEATEETEESEKEEE